MRRFKKLEIKSSAIAIPATEAPISHVMPTVGANIDVTKIEKKIPRIVFDDPSVETALSRERLALLYQLTRSENSNYASTKSASSYQTGIWQQGKVESRR